MPDPESGKPTEDAVTKRLNEREAMRREAADLNTASPAGLEGALSRISDEVTADAEQRIADRKDA
jgi:hypothetical protein